MDHFCLDEEQTSGKKTPIEKREIEKSEAKNVRSKRLDENGILRLFLGRFIQRHNHKPSSGEGEECPS